MRPRLTRLLAGSLLLLASPAILGAQERRDTTRVVPDSVLRADSVRADSLRLARLRADSLRADSLRAAARRDSLPDIFGDYADLGLQLQARIETRAEQNRNERCYSSQFFTLGANCRAGYLPQLEFQFNLQTGGTVAERVHVDVDYDSEREFDASNNVSLFYEGRGEERLQRVELGNVSFALPPSRFITSGIPSGNYGVQAIARLGSARVRAIYAQQKGNVVRDRIFTVGDQALQTIQRDIDDYQLEPRRFFFTVDPALFAGYPNIDILDRQQLGVMAAALPDSVRPTRVYLYRLQLGSPPRNPNGPQFIVRGGNLPQTRGQIYEYLREGVDYYIDPSQLWVALVRPLNVNNERLVVAYRVRVDGRDTVVVSTGGTPDIEFQSREQFANLLWDPSLIPADDAFRQELRSVYRIGGGDIVREGVHLAVVTSAGGQEKPVAGTADTYLEMFGLAQSTSGAAFDAENRIWPRPGDPNFNIAAAGSDARIIADNFLVFPSLRPFSVDGLVEPGNPVNDTLYTIPGEYLYSTQRPQSVYRIRTRYDARGSGDVAGGSLNLGAVQLRQGSERLIVDGVALTRGTDYEIDYDLGRVTFTRPDTLFSRRRTVTAQFEENPLFAPAPTRIYGLSSLFPTDYGDVHVTMISQSQRTTFNRPPLGFEPLASVLAGITANFAFDASPLTRALDALPMISTDAPSRINFQGEFATSRPQPHTEGLAYIETFEGERGIQIPLGDPVWYYSSRPLPGSTFPTSPFELDRAATMAWQSNARRADGSPIVYTLQQIDTAFRTAGQGFGSEQILWLSLYPLNVGGKLDVDAGVARWTVPGAPGGRRWRSVRTVLSPSGTDLTRIEQLEFWSLLDTTQIARDRHPTLVFDFGDISENTVAFSPETLYVRPRPGGGVDSVWVGKQLQGYDRLDTERDSLSRVFNVVSDDTGLPGDVAESLVVVDEVGEPRTEANVFICIAQPGDIHRLGDTRTNCTVRNNRLDEEDIDQDFVLNMTDERQATDERFLRYVIDLSDSRTYAHTGLCSGGQCWVQFRIPFTSATDTVNAPNLRRMRALRVTMVSGALTPDDVITTVPIARLRLVGAPWLKRDEQVLSGVAGDGIAGGYVLTGLVGTQDRATLGYESPPGVGDLVERRGDELQIGQGIINETALRLQAVGIPLYHRAEAFFRFPEGQKSFMNYRTLRVWARGRGNGWGAGGAAELEFFLKVGRDENNFYLYRTPVSAGPGRAAWEPEIQIQFERFFTLRERVQNAFLRDGPRIQGCTGVDSALIAQSQLPAGFAGEPYAACDGGYMVLTMDPNLTAPNLHAVQELAVGIVRVNDGSTLPGGIMPGDTLELWVNDIRLSGVESTPGYAGQIGLSAVFADVADLRFNASRRDPHFRQLTEQPTFITDDALDLASTVRLDRLLPARLGMSLPLSVSHTSTGTDPFFLSRSDIRGGAIEGLRTPRSSATSYSLIARRTTPLENRWLGPLLNDLAVSSSWANASSRTEYSDGRSRAWTVGTDWNIAAGERTVGLPGWMSNALEALPDWLSESSLLRAARTGRVRWSPTLFRVTSGLAHNEDRRFSYFKPVDAPDDEPRTSLGLNHIWRNSSVLEMRPTTSLALRWNILSLRDLRDYGDTTDAGSAARRETGEMLGLGVGFERERSMGSGITWTPAIRDWFRPRLTWGTNYTMRRDPNARSLVDIGAGALALPRRLTNQHALSLGTSFDLAGMIKAWLPDTTLAFHPRWRSILDAIMAIDAGFDRNVLSAFDGTASTPGLGYQFAIGGIDDFRTIDGRLATSAGVTHTKSLGGGLRLPLGLTVLNRFRLVEGRNWTRRFDETHALVENRSVTLPDLTVRWSWRPPALRFVIDGVGAQVGLRKVAATTLVPVALGGELERTRSEVTQLPVSGSISWGFLRGLGSSASYTLTTRDDSRPGSLGESRTEDMSFDLSGLVPMPDRFDLRSDLRLRTGYQQSRTESYTLSTATGRRSRLTDNGRQAFNLNADTDLADNLTFSLQGSRVVTFDDNLGRRYTQTVFSVVLQLQFFAGELR
ncbi:MAG TPA: cell surface protein SprA [Gemmatimonadaceae bacterium]|nr:cell surface protein SprA [Gemmatimonadaceae bacterium]